MPKSHLKNILTSWHILLMESLDLHLIQTTVYSINEAPYYSKIIYRHPVNVSTETRSKVTQTAFLNIVHFLLSQRTGSSLFELLTPKNLILDTKIGSLWASDPKLDIYQHIEGLSRRPSWILCTSCNHRELTLDYLDSSPPKTWF